MKLGWVDYSREERNKIIHILRNLRTQSAVDELGIGTIRDAFSDMLFPGVSTLHTRAKYYILIPYLFHDAKSESFKKASEVRSWIEKQQDVLVKTLLTNSEPGTSGIIGGRMHQSGGSVKYKPSGTYWNGLKIWGIVRNPDISLDTACAVVYEKAKRRKEIHLKNETENDGGDDKDNLYDNIELFAPILPKYDYRSKATIDLLNNEAKFLIDQITSYPNTKDTLLAYMLKEEYLPARFEDIDDSLLPKEIGKVVKQAQEVADFIYGAHLLFNVIYSESTDTDIVERFEHWLNNEYHPIDLDAVISVTRCSHSTADFLKRFDRFIQDKNIPAAQKLLIQREKNIKGDRAKLTSTEKNKYKGPIHAYKLYYRYPTVYQIVKDILEGLDHHA